VVEQAPDAILIYDCDQDRFISANPSAELLFGCPKEELINHGPQYFYTPDQPDARSPKDTFAEHNRRALSGEEVSFERRIRNSHGKELTCEVRLARLPSAEGRLLRSSFIDITDRKLVEENLLLSNALLASEIESAPDGVLVIQSEPARASFNQKFLDMWSLSSAFGDLGDPEVILEAVLNHLNDAEGFREDIMRFRVNPGLPIHREIELRDDRVFDCYSGAMERAPGVCLGRIYFFRDITEKKRSEVSLREQRDFNTALLGSLPGIFILLDANGRYVRWNDNLRQLTGLSDVQLLGFDCLSLVVDADRAAVKQKIQEAFAVGRGQIEFSVHRRSGGVRTLSWTGQRVTSEEHPYLLAVGTDVTEARQVDLRLRASEERFRSIFNSVNDGIFLSDPATGKFLDANQRGCEMAGYSIEEIVGSNVDLLSSGVPPYTQDAVLEWLKKAKSDGPQMFEWHCKTKAGEYYWAEVSLRFASFGTGDVILAAVRDITERKRTQQQIADLARFDVLTGLPNRRMFLEAMENAIARARRSIQSFAVLYLDLDHFKDVNDTLGHPIGDLLLQMVSERLRASVRQIDTAARFGGDEFSVIVADIREPADAAVVANKLLSVLREPFVIEGNVIRSGTSVGIAVYGSDSADAETLLSHADVALYRAKGEGRGTYRFFTNSMDTEVRARVTLGTELREAIAAGQFFLMYQPQVDSDTGRIVGLEALLRWRHPRLGIVGPAEFIPVAEHSGQIVTLERWVLREACRQTRQWLDEGIAVPLIAINVSVIEFKTPLELEHSIAATLEEFGLSPQFLELELTEGVLMEASREHNNAMLRLRGMGLRIAIDDFGNGYSSLDYLRRFSVERIKIAQNFIADLGVSSGNRAIVRAALGLARELGLEVVVEGVETAAQLELLKAWGCRIVQGYYFAKPLPAADVTPLLRIGKITPLPAETLDTSVLV
jgi:diguanylate cyclase (GGDEF)-like protein/PAS domain S-box-containing protein